MTVHDLFNFIQSFGRVLSSYCDIGIINEYANIHLTLSHVYRLPFEHELPDFDILYIADKPGDLSNVGAKLIFSKTDYLFYKFCFPNPKAAYFRLHSLHSQRENGCFAGNEIIRSIDIRTPRYSVSAFEFTLKDIETFYIDWERYPFAN